MTRLSDVNRMRWVGDIVDAHSVVAVGDIGVIAKQGNSVRTTNVARVIRVPDTDRI